MSPDVLTRFHPAVRDWFGARDDRRQHARDLQDPKRLAAVGGGGRDRDAVGAVVDAMRHGHGRLSSEQLRSPQTELNVVVARATIGLSRTPTAAGGVGSPSTSQRKLLK